MQSTNPNSEQSRDRAFGGTAMVADRVRSSEPPAMALALIGVDEIDTALRGEWLALGEAAGDPNPYFLPWFLEPAMRHLDPSRRVKLVLLRHVDTGLLIAVLPIVFQKGYAKLPLKHACVWTHKHCFNGAPLIRAGFAIAAYVRLFDWIDTRPEGAGFLRFATLPFDHKTHAALDAACVRRDREFLIQDYHERAILTADDTFDGVMRAAMSGKKRKELRRQERRFDELGDAKMTAIPLAACQGDGVIAELCETFLALENAGWKSADPEGFPLAQSIADTRFFREAMKAGAEAGAVDCLSLTLDGEAKAMLFILRMGKHSAAFKTSYDEGFAAYSPGVRILIEATKRMLDGDGVRLDSCARQGHPVVDGLWPGRLPIVQINIPASRAADKTLLGTAAALEKFKIGALKRLNGKGA